MVGDVGAGIEGQDRARVLFMYGEAAGRSALTRSLVDDVAWPLSVVSVETRKEWRRHSFAEQVDEIDAQLERFSVAVGHGYEAWLLMAACEQRERIGKTIPFLMLINPVLGCSQHLNGALVGYRAPRSLRVRSAFGLDRREEGKRPLIARAAYLFGDNDRFSAETDWQYLRGLGSQVHVIRGWHDTNRARVGMALRDILIEHARGVVEAMHGDARVRAASESRSAA